MLKLIRELFNKTEDDIGMVNNNKEEATVEVAKTVVNASVDVEALMADLQAKEGLLQEKTEALAAITEAKAELEKKLAAFEEDKLKAEADAKQVKMKARFDAVVNIVGEAKAEDFVKATESLDDVAFDAVKGALAGSVEKEAAKPEFKEVGVDAKADTSDVGEQSRVMAMIQKKFGKN